MRRESFAVLNEKSENKEVKVKKLLSKIAILVLLMLIVSIRGSNQTASINKYTNKMSPLNQINENFLREYVLKRLPKDAKLISINATIVYFNNSKVVFKPTPIYPSLEHQWGITYYYVTNVTKPYEDWNMQYIAKIVGSSDSVPITIYLLQSEEIPNSFNANVGVSAKVVSANVGFDLTRTYITTLQNNLSIPVYSYGVIEAYPVYEVYNYNVMYKPFIGSPYKIGYGNANRAVGVFYLKYVWK